MKKEYALKAKQERLTHANKLIQLISSYGRRFFYNKNFDRVAYFKLDEKNRLWFVDDFTDKPIYMQKTGFGNKWRGFTHGGTLRSLVEMISDYIRSGRLVDIGVIAPQRTFDESNIWGYPSDAVIELKAEVCKLPIMLHWEGK